MAFILPTLNQCRHAVEIISLAWKDFLGRATTSLFTSRETREAAALVSLSSNLKTSRGLEMCRDALQWISTARSTIHYLLNL